MPRPSDLSVAGVTHVGRRVTNQDCFRVGAVPGTRGRIVFVAVADGVGGQPEGARAAETAIWAFQDGICGIRPDREETYLPTFTSAVCDAYRGVVSLADRHSDGRKPSTTLVCALVWGRRAIAANLGDSRFYVVTGRGIRQISRDHTRLATAIRKGYPREKLVHLRDALDRYLGKTPEVKPDVFDLSLPKSAILFFCTDGVTGSIRNAILTGEEIRHELLARPTLEDSLRNVMRISFEKGSRDNITAAAVEVGRVPREPDGTDLLPPLPGEQAVSAGPTGG